MCQSCGDLRDATKQLQMFTYPQVLLLCLKRFETRGGSKGGNSVCERYSARKVSTRVRLEQQLDLSRFCNQAALKAAAAAGRRQPRYELLAVTDHTGHLHGGHYTARGRSVLDGSWVEFNDSVVRAAGAPSGSTRDAYMMLYRLVG
jgi:ubiquitin C-terminal hydrolase